MPLDDGTLLYCWGSAGEVPAAIAVATGALSACRPLRGRGFSFWVVQSPGAVSNREPSAYKAGALPIELTGRKGCLFGGANNEFLLTGAW